MIPLAVFPTYTLFGGDVSQFANQTAGLSITALGVTSGPGPNPVLLDNIQFSSAPIPEPSSLALVALGGLFIGWRGWAARR
jgi:PEP-CTERM motif